MPKIYETKFDGTPAISYSHIPLFGYFFHEARNHALAAKSTQGMDEFKQSLLTVIFCSLSLEAFINEFAEDKVANEDKDDFNNLKGKFKRGSSSATSITWKIRLTFELFWKKPLDLEGSPLKGIERLVKLRNSLVHYNPQEAAARTYLAPPKTVPVEGGTFMTVIDFVRPPIAYEPSLVERINKYEAASAFNALLQTAKLWNKCADAPPNNISSQEEIVIGDKDA